MGGAAPRVVAATAFVQPILVSRAAQRITRTPPRLARRNCREYWYVPSVARGGRLSECGVASSASGSAGAAPAACQHSFAPNGGIRTRWTARGVLGEVWVLTVCLLVCDTQLSLRRAGVDGLLCVSPVALSGGVSMGVLTPDGNSPWIFLAVVRNFVGGQSSPGGGRRPVLCGWPPRGLGPPHRKSTRQRR